MVYTAPLGTGQSIRLTFFARVVGRIFDIGNLDQKMKTSGHRRWADSWAVVFRRGRWWGLAMASQSQVINIHLCDPQKTPQREKSPWQVWWGLPCIMAIWSQSANRICTFIDGRPWAYKPFEYYVVQ